jgi:ribosomal protein L18E
VLRRRGGKKGKRHAMKSVPFSHQDSSSIGGEYLSIATWSLLILIDNEYLLWATIDPSETSNTPPFSTQRDSPSLFVSENEEENLVLQGQTTLKPPDNVLSRPPYMAEMDGLKRTRAIKVEIENNIAILKPQDKKTGNKHVEDDPENQLIKSLRQEQSMSWNDIANYLNQERRNRGEAASFTDAAVYSRFVRNAPRIAAAVGEVGFDPKDYMHLRNPNQYTSGEGTGMISKAGKKRIKNYDNAKELEANMRKQVKVDENSELETAEKTEQLMQAVAKVERNFWKFVADEMERSTTKFYPANALASRYHAI